MPAPSPAGFTETLMVEGAVPVVLSSESHDCVLAAVQFRVPPPVLVIEITWAPGAPPPTVAVKLRDAGPTVSSAAAGVPVPVTVKLTG